VEIVYSTSNQDAISISCPVGSVLALVPAMKIRVFHEIKAKAKTDTNLNSSELEGSLETQT